MSILHRREFVKNSALYSAAAFILPQLSRTGNMNTTDLPRATPESMGVSSEAILQYLQEANKSGLEHHGFMFLRHGKVIAEGYWKPFERHQVHTLYSLSKSFTSTAVGLAVKEGLIKLSDKVISFFPELLPEVVSNNLAKMEIHHALSMATGHTSDTIPSMRAAQNVSWVKTFLARPVEKEPGTHFLYNTGSSYVLSAIVSKVSGQSVQEYLSSRLYKPLGITQADWEQSPEGYNVGGYGLRVTADDIARFGQLYLQKGSWNGNQILPSSYVEEATKSHINSNPGDGDWSQGYGYQYWRCKPGFYRGDGAFGQFCIVMPQHDAVLAVLSESTDMQKQMTMMWNTILPGIKPQAMQEDKTKQDELNQLIKGLALPSQIGMGESKISKSLNGNVFQLNENQWTWNSIQINSGNKGGHVLLKGKRDTVEIPFGWNEWKINGHRLLNPFGNDYRSKVTSNVAATAGCTPEDILKIRLKYTEGIHGDLLSIKQSSSRTIEINLLHSLSEKNPNNKESRPVLTGVTSS